MEARAVSAKMFQVLKPHTATADWGLVEKVVNDARGVSLRGLSTTFTIVAVVMAGIPEKAINPIIASYHQRPVTTEADDNAFNDSPLAKRYVWQALPEVAPAPPNNPTTPEKVALGRRLFNDRRLSGDGTLNCGSCHDLYGHAGADGRRTATGINGQIGGRNAPTVWNAAFQSVMFWDGRAPSLEEQAKGPIRSQRVISRTPGNMRTHFTPQVWPCHQTGAFSFRPQRAHLVIALTG